MSLIIKYFSITKALSDGFNFYFKNLKLLFPILAIVALVALLILSFFTQNFHHPYFHYSSYNTNSINFSYSFGSNLGVEHLLGLVLLSIYKALMINFCLKIYDNPNNTNFSYADFWNIDFDLFSYLIAKIRYIITSIAGMIFFIIPGLILIPKYYFAHYFVIDKKLNIGESFAASSALTYGVLRKIWLFILIKAVFLNSFFAGFASIIAILIFLTVYVPISIFAKVSIYRQLLAPKTIQ